MTQRKIWNSNKTNKSKNWLKILSLTTVFTLSTPTVLAAACSESNQEKTNNSEATNQKNDAPKDKITVELKNNKINTTSVLINLKINQDIENQKSFEIEYKLKDKDVKNLTPETTTVTLEPHQNEVVFSIVNLNADSQYDYNVYEKSLVTNEEGKQVENKVKIGEGNFQTAKDTRVIQKSKDLNFQDFYNDIVDSANNEYPSVFLTRNSAQIYLSSFLAATAQLDLITKKEKAQNIETYNDVVMPIDYQVYSYQRAKSDTYDPAKERFDFKQLLDTYGDVVTPQKTITPKGSLVMLDNNAYLNAPEPRKYLTNPVNVKELLSYIQPYIDKGVKKFDFYLPEITFQLAKDDVKMNLIKYANKIILLSDGMAQPFYFYENDYLKKFAYINQSFPTLDAVEKVWNNIQNASDSTTMTKEFKSMNWRNFYRLNKHFRIYSIDSNYNRYFEKDINPAAKLDVKDLPVNILRFKEEFKLSDDFYSTYLKTLKTYNKDFNEFIFHNANKLDPNKKNLVFLGSSFFRENNDNILRLDLPAYKDSLKELHDIFAVIKQKYDPKEYNYIFKLHPYYRNYQAINYVNKITNNFENAIIMNPSYSWESILESEYSRLKLGKSILFSENDFKVPGAPTKTTLWGFQGTTTSLFGTLLFLQKAFNISWKEALPFANIQNFPIPNTFHLIWRDIHESKQSMQKRNYLALSQVYKYYIIAGAFPSLDQFLTTDQFLNQFKNKKPSTNDKK